MVRQIQAPQPDRAAPHRLCGLYISTRADATDIFLL